ncbi:iron complex transport system substrate-binding protein [Paenibacillus endophyticus]|uniref:Iron complex transport system substrate-binding protein n=1 Tax=Paenibacillus endophyticus TaxID=1294268 RepID=A0A7W5C593_9BACL|nr:ABC transporter substrate-binding protein [Paenibacillus endophyticus]MBB3151428.1 iron complex transport system substrate-binding protein [Paenibacillus endophyticus]
MYKKHARLLLLCFLLLSVSALAACGSKADNESAASNSEQSTTRVYKDFSGHEVTIPTNPQKIVMLGDIPGDLLALGIKPAGNDWLGEPYVYKSELEGVVDIGYPHNMEKIIELAPDLILQAGYGGDDEEKIFQDMSKIAPTVVFNRDAVTYDRIREVADIVGKKQVAEDWITSYESKAKATWDKIGLKPGETATVYLSLGGDFYVMGHFSLTMSLYQPQGFSASEKVQALIDKAEPFSLISQEVLPDFAGDHLFLLSAPGTEDEKAAKALIDSPLWKSIPAVKNNRAYLASISWNASDPITMERFLDELPKIMGIK